MNAWRVNVSAIGDAQSAERLAFGNAQLNEIIIELLQRDYFYSIVSAPGITHGYQALLYVVRVVFVIKHAINMSSDKTVSGVA